MVKKAYKRVWMIGRLKYLGAQVCDLIDVYVKQVRSVLELAVPAWHGAITLVEQQSIERVQKSVAHIILGEEYVCYKDALNTLGLKSLATRRNILCLKFAKKAEKHTKFQKWFKISNPRPNTRQAKMKYCQVLARHSRFQKSPLSHLTRILNEYYLIK